VYVLCLCVLYLLVIDQHNGMMWPKFIPSMLLCQCFTGVVYHPLSFSAEVKAIPLLPLCGSYCMLWSDLYPCLKYRDTSAFQEI